MIFHPSFGVKCCLGNSEKAGSYGGRGVRGTVERLLNYRLLSVEREPNEKTIQEEKREPGEATAPCLGWFGLLVYTPPPLSLPQNTLWKYSWGKASKRSSVLCTSSLDGGNKTASTLAKCIVVFCSECFSVPFSFCQFHFSLRTLRRFTVFSLEENINNVAISVYLIHFKDLPTGKLSCFVFGFCFFYPF